MSGGAPPCEYPTKTRSRSNSHEDQGSNNFQGTLSESSQLYEELNKERLMFLENNIKIKNDFIDTKIVESVHSDTGDILHGNITLPNNGTSLMPILASVAPSDSTS